MSHPPINQEASHAEHHGIARRSILIMRVVMIIFMILPLVIAWLFGALRF